MLDGHGDDLHLAKGQIKHNFSSNVYHKGCPTLLQQELVKSLETIENYPSPAATELSISAAKYHGLSPNQFLFTNGATEAFYLIAQLFKGKKTCIVSPTFSEYEDACRIHELDITIISRDQINHVDSDLTWICNPNNPTGEVFSINQLSNLITSKPTTTFVIDEAYIEFTQATDSILPLINAYNNLIVVRSLTKTFTIPGIRLGYIACNHALIDQLLSIKMPWSVNSIAIKCGLFIFDNYSKLSFDIKELMYETAGLQRLLDSIEWLNILPSNTSYLLVELKKGQASELKKYLMEEHQILIRDATNFNGLEGEFIRIATQDLQTNKTLIDALLKWK